VKKQFSKILFSLLITLSTFTFKPAFGQILPLYSHFNNNRSILNPSMIAIDAFTIANLSVRNQWVNFDGAPKSQYGQIQMPFFNGNKPIIENYYSNFNSLSDLEALPSHHGLGLTFSNEKSGNFKRTSFDLNYAYHIAVSNTNTLSGGIGFSTFNFQYNYAGVNTPVLSDPLLMGNQANLNKLKTNLSAGISFYNPSFFLGISVLQIAPTNLKFNESDQQIESDQTPHLFLMAGRRWNLSEDYIFSGSILLRRLGNTGLINQTEIFGNIGFKNLLKLGLGYRSSESLMGNFECAILPSISVSYAYDHPLNKARITIPPSHEILIKFKFNRMLETGCPQVSF